MNDLLKVISEARESVPEERPTANIDFQDILFDESDNIEPELKKTYPRRQRGGKAMGPSMPKLKESVATDDVPWLPREYVAKMAKLPYLTRLNLEILQYVAYCTLTDAENAARLHVLNQLQDIIQLVLPEATIDVFGSYSTGMATYSSDIDICVNIPIDDATILHKHMASVAALLHASISTNYVDVRSHARVPIIKGVHDELLLEYDISFNSPHGAAHKKAIVQYIEQHPLARVLLIIVKSFLKKRGLNQPYTGGMSSYILLQLIMVYISERHNVFPYHLTGERIGLLASGNSEPDKQSVTSMDESNAYILAKAGAVEKGGNGKRGASASENSRDLVESELLSNRFHATSLIEFFELFGTIYNAEHLTIYTNPRGNESFVTSRGASGFYHQSLMGSPPLLSILNSHDPTNECAGGVTRYRYIRSSFELAYLYLLRNKSGSILSFIVDIDFAAMRTRELCKEWYEKSSANASQVWAEKLESLIALRSSGLSHGNFQIKTLNSINLDGEYSETLSEIST